MKHIADLENDIISLEVYECDCGMHIGVDATYLEQVNGCKIECPNCGDIYYIIEED